MFPLTTLLLPLLLLLLLLLAGSLTTMTTIGYGDRGPQNTPEIIFVMFAEVIGLSIFALLLQQICDLSAAMQSEEKAQNQIKDDLVQFLEKNNVSHKLITRSVDYLIYRTYFTPKTTEHLPYLTDSLQHQIRVEIYKVSVPLRVFGIGKVLLLIVSDCCISQPILVAFRLFGRAPEDARDQARMEELFTAAGDH